MKTQTTLMDSKRHSAQFIMGIVTFCLIAVIATAALGQMPEYIDVLEYKRQLKMQAQQNVTVKGVGGPATSSPTSVMLTHATPFTGSITVWIDGVSYEILDDETIDVELAGPSATVCLYECIWNGVSWDCDTDDCYVVSGGSAYDIIAVGIQWDMTLDPAPPPVNLTVSSFSAPSTAEAFQDIAGLIDLDIQNTSTVDLTNVKVRIVLDGDSDLSSPFWNLSVFTIPLINAGQTVSASIPSAPLGHLAGSFYIGAQVDWGTNSQPSEIPESDETDNQASSPITISPNSTEACLYYEDFQGGDGGWTTFFRGAQPLFWNATIYEGRTVAWCGDNQPSWSTPPGYANNWDQRLTRTVTLGPASVSMDYIFQYDVELNWDFVYIEVSTDGGLSFTTLDTYTGDSSLEVDADVDGFVPRSTDLSAYANQTVEIRFRFLSDFTYSDEDGLFDSNGAFRIDEVQVTGYPLDTFDRGFEEWVASVPTPPFEFRLEETPLCTFGPAACEPTTHCNAWVAYEPGTGEFPFGGPGDDIDLGIESPIISIPADATNLILQYDVFRNLPLSNAIFYRWEVAIPHDAPFQTDFFIYYGAPQDWLRGIQDITRYMKPGATTMKIRLSAYEWTGFVPVPPSHTSSPYFDNVQVISWGSSEPGVDCSGSPRPCGSVAADVDEDGVTDDVDLCIGEVVPFNYDRDGDGCNDAPIGARHTEYWENDDFPVEWTMSADGLPGVPNTELETALQSAYNVWATLPALLGGEVSFQYNGTIAQSVASAMDGVNLATMTDNEFPFPSSVLAVGITTSFIKPGFFGSEVKRPNQIFDFDLIFNPRKSFKVDGFGDPNGTDLQAAATHEVGHGIGISHSAIQTATMHYVLPSGLEARSPAIDDVVAVLKAYPNSTARTTASRLSGKVLDGATGPTYDGVAGVIVFCINSVDETDTLACEYTLPDGSFEFFGLPDGSYYLAMHALDASSEINFIGPNNINQLVFDTAVSAAVAEYWDLAEGDADNSADKDPIAVAAGTPVTGVEIITNVDLTGPTVDVPRVRPADGDTGVPIDPAVTIWFDEAIDGGSVQGGFRIRNNTTGRFVPGNAALFDNGTRLTFLPSGGLDFTTSYTIEVLTGISDLFGNALQAEFFATFITEAKPAVSLTHLSPSRGSGGAVVVVSGDGFDSDPLQNQVTLGVTVIPVLEASSDQIVVEIPAGTATGFASLTVTNLAAAETSNSLDFETIQNVEVARGFETGTAVLNGSPRALTVLANGDYTFVATTGGVSVVVTDDASANYLDQTNIPVVGGLDDVDATPDGKFVFGISRVNRTVYRINANPGNGPLQVLNETQLVDLPRGIHVGLAGERAYVPTDAGEIIIWDLREGTDRFDEPIGVMTTSNPNFTGKLTTDPVRNHLLALSALGKVLMFDLNTDTYVDDIVVGSAPSDIVVDPAAVRAYVADDAGFVSIVSLLDSKRITDISTGGSLVGAAIAPGGSFLYALDENLNFIDLIDLRETSQAYRTVAGRVPQGINPLAIALSNDGRFAFTVIEASEELSVTAVAIGPTLHTISKRSGPVGTQLVLAGTDFTSGTSAEVSFNGSNVPPDRLAAGLLTVVAPVDALSGAVNVIISNPGESDQVSNAIFFDVLGATGAGALRIAASEPGAPNLGAVSGGSVMAMSPDGDMVVVADLNGGCHVFDTDPASLTYNQYIGSASFGSVVGDAVVAPGAERAFVLLPSASEVKVLDVNRRSAGFMTELWTIDLSSVAGSPSRIALAPGNDRLFVTIGSSIAGVAVDSAPVSPPGVPDVTVDASSSLNGGVLGDIHAHPGGAYVYVSATGSNPPVMIAVDTDPSSGTFFDVVATAALPVGAPLETPTSFDFTPDGARVVVVTSGLVAPANRSVVLIDTSDPTNPVTGPSVSLGVAASVTGDDLAMSPRGDRVIVGMRDSGLFHYEIQTGPDAMVLAEQTGVPADFSAGFQGAYAPDGLKYYGLSESSETLTAYDFNAAATIAVDSGDNQTGIINEPLPLPLRVQVSGAGSVAYIPVKFEIIGGDAMFTESELTTQTVETDEDGFAELGAMLGGTAGTQIVHASAAGLGGSPVVFTLTAVVDPVDLPLTQLGIAPVDGATNVSTTTVIQVKFSKPIDPATISYQTFYLTQNGSRVPAIYGFAGENTKVSLTPMDPLDYSASYNVTITAGVDGGYVNFIRQTLTNPVTTEFSTEVPPFLALDAANPPSSTKNNTIVLSGTGFEPGNNTVLFDGVQGAITSESTDFINVTVPFNATSGDVTVTAGSQTSNPLPFNVLIPRISAIDNVIANVGRVSATNSISITPDGTRAYAVSPVGVVIPIDLQGYFAYEPIRVGTAPFAITIDPKGSFAYVTNLVSGTLSVIDINPLSAGYNSVAETIDVGEAPVDVAVTPDGDRVLVANAGSNNLSVIDSDQSSVMFRQVIANVGTASRANTIAITPDGGRVFVGTDFGYLVLNGLNFGVIANVGAATGTQTLRITPDGTLMFVQNVLGQIVVYDVAPGSSTENQVIANVRSSSSAQSLAITPDGTQAYIVQKAIATILVFSTNMPSTVSAIDPDAAREPFELELVASFEAGENPSHIAFDPTGLGVMAVTDPGASQVIIFGDPGAIEGVVLSDTPAPNTGVGGITVDAFATGSGDLVLGVVTDVDGTYFGELPPGEYTITIVTPLGYVAETEEITLTIGAGETVVVDFGLTAVEIIAQPRGVGYWKHQVGVALGGKGNAELDSDAVCDLLDLVYVHFNGNDKNSVVVYEPPESGLCEDKLAVAKDLLNLKGKKDMVEKARQHLMSLLMNVAAEYISLTEVISDDGATVSQAITYCDNLIDDGEPSNDEIAKDVAEMVNNSHMVPEEVIPLSTDDIAYSPPLYLAYDLEQNYPNPFNPTTTIRFSIAEAAHVRLIVYDVTGRVVRSLVDEQRKADFYQVKWDGRNDVGSSVSSGVYFYKLVAGHYTKTRKMVMLK